MTLFNQHTWLLGLIMLFFSVYSYAAVNEPEVTDVDVAKDTSIQKETEVKVPVKPQVEKEECKEDWLCGDWSGCVDGIRSRSCTDRNDCGTTSDLPPLVIYCENEIRSIVPRDFESDLEFECLITDA
ncbi:MAG: hypothetical protein AABX90_03210, partial [Nanoarchaeota archaeon]